MADVEEYFGCQCRCLNHISQFLYFYPQEGDDPYDDHMYFTVNSYNIYDRIVPPFSIDPRNWEYDFGTYFRFHIFRKFWIALRHILSPYYKRKFGILDSADYEEKDLPRMDRTLKSLIDSENCESVDSIVYINNRDWQLRFTIWRLDEDLPYWLGWEIHFEPGQLLHQRIRNAFRFLIGRNLGEQSFDIDKSRAARLRGMITATIGVNTIKKINEEL